MIVRRRDRDAKGVEGEMGSGIPSHPTRGSGENRRPPTGFNAEPIRK